MKTILLKLSGPLQSWGTYSHFETRQTDRYPSKSAVIGMIAASLGYRRDENEKIQQLNDLDFGVRIDQIGKSMRDYQTVKKYKKSGALDRTYVTNRYYLEDAVFVIAISHENDQFMQEIEYGLKNPYFQPFMGRRSLPLTADFYLESNNNSVIENLKSINWQAAPWYQKENANELEVYVDADLIEEGSNHMRQDKVQSFSQKGRSHGFRSERRLRVVVNHNNSRSGNIQEHDAFGALGG